MQFVARIVFLTTLFLSGPAAAESTLKLHVTEIPGQTMSDEDEPGTALEIVRAAAEQAGLSLEERFTPWPRAVSRVETEPYAIIVPFGRILSREKCFTWVSELYELQFGFVALDDPIDSIEAARSLNRIGVWRGSSMMEDLERLGFDSLAPVSNDQALSRMLVNGRIDAWYGSLNEAAYKFRGIKEFNGRKIWFDTAIDSSPVWIAGGRLLSPVIVERLQSAMRQLKDDGTIAAVRLRYGMDAGS